MILGSATISVASLALIAVPSSRFGKGKADFNALCILSL
jgi:hypothetical protein